MRKRRNSVWSEVSDETLRSIARIMGADSAAQKAIDDLARRRDVGDDAVCYRSWEHASRWSEGSMMSERPDTPRPLCEAEAANKQGRKEGDGLMAHGITAYPELRTIIIHDAGRGTTPDCHDARYKKGDVVKVRNRAALAHFPREAIVAAAVPPGFPSEYALADLLDEPRPLIITNPSRAVQYILVREGDLHPYLARESDLLPTGKEPVKIGDFARAPGPDLR